MNKLKITVVLILISVILACGTKKSRYEKCSHFSQKGIKTEQVHANI
jgi:hypothetical protein